MENRDHKPVTGDRLRLTPIDAIFVSAGLLESKCGYLPFVFDHRMLWVDLDLDQLFGQEVDISPRYKPKRLQNDDQRTRNRYLEKIYQLLEQESDFATRLDNLFDLAKKGVPLSTTQQREFEDLLLIHKQAACQAEKCCRKLFMGNKLWTPTFTANCDRRLFWLKLIAILRGKKTNSRLLQRMAKKAGVSDEERQVAELSIFYIRRIDSTNRLLYVPWDRLAYHVNECSDWVSWLP